jgi:hypothetical protein
MSNSIKLVHFLLFSGNAARVGVQTAISAVRRRAVETMEIPSVITAEITQHLPRAVKGQLKGNGTFIKLNIFFIFRPIEQHGRHQKNRAKNPKEGER